MSHKFQGSILVKGKVQLPAESTERVAIVDASGELSSSVITQTELEYLDGASGNLQVQLNDIVDDVSQISADLTTAEGKIDDLVTLSGVAENSTDLGTFTGDIIQDNATVKEALQDLETSIESLPDPMEYKGVWNASTNTPTLTDGTGNNGDVYQVTVAGTQFTPSITFEVGDKVVYSGATGKYEKWDMTDAVASVNGQTGVVSLDSDDISEGAANLNFTDERAQDAVGTILDDTTSVQLVYDDGTPTITANVIPGGVDHDQLLNYVADDHVDHSTVEIQTEADSGLAGGGDITASRQLVVDPNNATQVSAASGDLLLVADVSDSNSLKKVTVQSILDLTPAASDERVKVSADDTTAKYLEDAIVTPASGGLALQTLNDGGDEDLEVSLDLPGMNPSASADNADLLLIYDDSASEHRKQTREDFLSGVAQASAGDIAEDSFSLSNDQSSPADVTGFAFANGVARSFKALVSVEIDATADLYEVFDIQAIQKGGSWDLAAVSTGDESGISFSITNAGQVQYTSSDLAGFVSGLIKFRAITTSV